MSEISVRQEIMALKAYVPGLSIAEIQDKYNLPQVIKMASNENPLGMPPLAREAARLGWTVVSGLDMLVHQAAAQFELFTGVPAPVEAMMDAGRAALA